MYMYAGGSYLGVEFVYEALRKESTAGAASGEFCRAYISTSYHVRVGLILPLLFASVLHNFLFISNPSRGCVEGRRIRFLANVDPVDVARALEGLNPG